jgi:uncharacterized lipoprotein YddW (UPF0748 family)
LVRQYGHYLWLDPGEKEVQDYCLGVIMDVVRRYDVDGVHIDDYFYPYQELDAAGNEIEFPDGPSWQRYGAGGKLSRDDWRRENVNTLIERLYRSIKAEKSWVKFGVSPFGIWRPSVPSSIDPKAFDAYAKLYADSRKWIKNGWVDYFTPQLYWPINPPEHSFNTLLKWWEDQNSKDRHLWPGMDSTKAALKLNPDEIVNEIRLTRKLSNANGHVHWNMHSLMRNRTLDDALGKEVYSQPALVPATTWLGKARPAQPTLAVATGATSAQLKAEWSANGTDRTWLWLLQTRTHGEWTTEILPAQNVARTFSNHPPDLIEVFSVDRLGNLSPPGIFKSATLRADSEKPGVGRSSSRMPSPKTQ